MKKILTITFTTVIAVLFLSLSQKVALAQSLSLSLWPPLLEVTIQPGRAVTQVYKLTNNSDHPLTVVPVVYPFTPEGNQGQIKIKQPGKAGEETNSFFSFASGEKLNQPFPLAVGQTKDVVLNIFIPKNTPENDYYQTLLFSTTASLEDSPTEGGQTSSVTQIGANILITVSKTGKPVYLARIVRFSAPLIVDSFSPVSFEVLLENWGKAFWKPSGKIEITGIIKQKEEITLLEQNVLVDSTRQLTIPSWKPKLPFGPFKAKLTFVLLQGGSSEPGETQELSAETTVWYLPYKVTGILIAGIFCLIIFKKLRNMRAKRKNAS